MEPVLIEVDGKLSYFEGVTDPPILILAINKFSKYLFRSEKYKIHYGAILWAFMHEEKVSSHFDTGVLYIFMKFMRHFEEPWLQLMSLHMTRPFDVASCSNFFSCMTT